MIISLLSEMLLLGNVQLLRKFEEPRTLILELYQSEAIFGEALHVDKTIRRL